MNDMQLRQEIIEELDFEPGIDSRGIAVSVAGGVVTLSGHVPSYSQKVDAEKAVWRIKGVKALAQEIEVRLAEDAKVNDDEIATRAARILAWSSAVPTDSIRVKVSHGWITLTGTVDWHYQRFAAEAAVRRLTGIHGVVNNVEIKQVLKSEDVRDKIKDALRRHVDGEAARIQIDVVSPGEVTLAGNVGDYEERRAIERAAWAIPGVRKVHDNLHIEWRAD
ncbi:BON domain-containing protein [Luteibacter sp. Lutesp34]|uniref:BON domain-containing protein n=1 Tax=Luteibacter sp. Lutesp34 TaxID=3243030 RepID=UPI0039B6A6F6